MSKLLAAFLITFFIQTAPPPALTLWLDCIERGPYTGRAVANISYRYDGEFSIQVEDSRLLGDTETGTPLSLPFSPQPGEHTRWLKVNVGALKVVVWKVVFGGELHIVTAWDNPEIPDCPLNAEVTPSPTPEGGNA